MWSVEERSRARTHPRSDDRRGTWSVVDKRERNDKTRGRCHDMRSSSPTTMSFTRKHGNKNNKVDYKARLEHKLYLVRDALLLFVYFVLSFYTLYLVEFFLTAEIIQFQRQRSLFMALHFHFCFIVKSSNLDYMKLSLCSIS